VKAKKIHDGLAVLLAREPNAECDIHNDRLYVGDETASLTAGDKAALRKLGWRVDEGSWSIAT
jgi:hypothetical protein